MAATPCSGLALNSPKCVIVIPRPFDPQQIIAQCLQAGLDISGWKLNQSGVYLGVEAGLLAPRTA
eukprot:5680423-Pyramimonas_sp.AAC.1